MSQAFVSLNRLKVIVFFILFAFLVLCGRLFYLHVIDSERLKSYAENVRKSVRVLSSQRGDIFDVHGNILAATHSSYTVGVDPNFLKDEDQNKWGHLAFILEIPYADLEAAMKKKVRAKSGRLIRWASLAKNVDLKTYEAVMNLGITGVYGNRKNQRFYPGNELASHVIGYINHESVAVSGVEEMCDYYLRGQDGWVETEKDGRRRELAHKRSREISEVNGNNVYLTLDQRIQSSVEGAIDALVERYNPEGVSVIVSRPNDGSILGLANYPTFDLNEFFNTKLYPIANQRNRAITDTFEPGSTFKIVPASGVLNESEADPEDIFETGNEVVIYENRELRLPSDHHFYDRLSMAEIVIKSSNRGAAHLGMILGEDRLHAYAASFGFGERTDLGLRGEISGTLHPINRWDGLTITRMPMGHAVDGTPMQIHYAMSVIANKGLLMKPRIIDRITNTEDILLFEYPAITKRRVLSEFVSVKMADLLHEVVGVKGTGKRAAIKGYSVGGKTGTTQKIINGKYSSESHVASFSGFLPVEDPQIVITVVVDAPKVKGGIGYGGVVAAPVFKEIAENCIRYLEIRSSKYSNEWFATRKAGQ